MTPAPSLARGCPIFLILATIIGAAIVWMAAIWKVALT